MRKFMVISVAALALTGCAAMPSPKAATALAAVPAPQDVLDAAPASAWKDIPAEDIVIMTLADGTVFTYQLAPDFAPVHVANIRQLVRSGYFDGASILRVQDDYVVQWGRPDEDTTPAQGIEDHPPAEYENADKGLKAKGLVFKPLPWPDAYAAKAGFIKSWPAASDGTTDWLVHCYGMIGVARDVPPDTGSGTQLYTIIGHAPRKLDRNLTVVGRMLKGMDILADRPRGTETLGFYKDDSQRIRIVSAKMASDLPEATRPAFQILDSDTTTFDAWIDAKANSTGGFLVRAPGAMDVCNGLPPVRPRP